MTTPAAQASFDDLGTPLLLDGPVRSLVARRVGEVRRVLVASPGYLAARGTPRTPGDLASHDAIFSSGRPVPVEWRFKDGARGRVVRLAPRLLINEVEAALERLVGVVRPSPRPVPSTTRSHRDGG